MHVDMEYNIVPESSYRQVDDEYKLATWLLLNTDLSQETIMLKLAIIIAVILLNVVLSPVSIMALMHMLKLGSSMRFRSTYGSSSSQSS